LGLSAGFSCPTVTVKQEPKDISELHPAHVSIAMAVGDSITAAFTARSDLLEARDISWSIGKGSADHMTLPWLMEQYSPKVEGQSTKALLPKDIAHLPAGDYHPTTDNMNVAESEGSANRGSLDEQWAYLQSNFQNYDNFDSRWKVLTVWMVANDVSGECEYNFEDTQHGAVWESKLEKFLENATSTLTNTYINLVSMLDLSNIARIQRSKIGCKIEHELIIQEAGCIDRGNATQLAQLDRNVHWMNSRQHQFASEWREKLQQQGRTDLAIVSQGFLEGLGAQFDWQFLSKLDCFHPSASAHQALAVGLWNSMLCTDDRANRCGDAVNLDIKPVCPTASSVFYTGPDVVPLPLSELVV